MIVELRTYTLVADGVREWERLYRELGREAQLRHLPRLLGYYTSEIGQLNQVISLWEYDSYEERAQSRAALWQDAGWLAFAERVKPLIVEQECSLLRALDVQA